MEIDIRGTEKSRTTWGYFPLLETISFFKKSLVPHVASLRITPFLKTHTRFGLFYCTHHLLTRGQIVCIIAHLMSLYLVCELSHKVIFNQTKPVAKLALLFEAWICTANRLSHTLTINTFGSKLNINQLLSYTDNVENIICLREQFVTFKSFLWRSWSKIFYYPVRKLGNHRRNASCTYHFINKKLFMNRTRSNLQGSNFIFYLVCYNLETFSRRSIYFLSVWYYHTFLSVNKLKLFQKKFLPIWMLSSD